MAGVLTFQITVPRKTGPGELQISAMRAILSMESDAPVTFQITDPLGLAVAVGPISPGSLPQELDFSAAPAGAVGPDHLAVWPPAGGLLASDPKRRIYDFYFDLLSDYTTNLPSPCSTAMAADETWTIAVTAGPEISGVCLRNFDLDITGAECGATQRLVPISEPVAEVVGFPASACPEVRPGVDAILVLDRSGSMGSPVAGAGSQEKIAALRDAVVDFVSVWNSLRTGEGAGAPTDNIGVALFDHNAAWWAQTPGGLSSFAATQANIIANVNTITLGGATSIGDGLILADGQLTAAAQRKVILLMSDGMQNSDQMVMVEGGVVKTHPYGNPAAKVNLPNQASYQVYSVTVGTAGVIDPVINQDLANATKGFYINSEDNAGLLSPFFIELLQNFLHFNSWETYRMASGQVSRKQPFSTTFPVTTTTQFLTVNLRWAIPNVRLRLSVQPPGESQPTEAAGSGNVVLRFDVPTFAAYHYLQDWQISVEMEGGIDLTHAVAQEFQVPFELFILGEDATLDSEMTIVEDDYVPGDAIQLEARVVEFGRPLANLGSQPGATVVARVVKPGVGIGDLLSTSTASTVPPTGTDSYSPVQAKLHNELMNNPNALQRDSSDTVTLVDSGNGLYRGTYTAQTPGHYNFLFGLEGDTQRAGRFSRMQLKTVYVRPAPDMDTTAVQTSIQPGDGQNSLLALTITPRTRFGHRLGPGWSNYFWFKPASGKAVKGVDNGNGSYTASIPFTGLLPPAVSLHFLNIAQVLPDDVPFTEDDLPVPLNADNTLTPNVGWPDLLKRVPWWVALLLLLLMLFYWIRNLLK